MEGFGVVRADGSLGGSPAFVFPRNSRPIRSQTRLARTAGSLESAADPADVQEGATRTL